MPSRECYGLGGCLNSFDVAGTAANYKVIARIKAGNFEYPTSAIRPDCQVQYSMNQMQRGKRKLDAGIS